MKYPKILFYLNKERGGAGMSTISVRLTLHGTEKFSTGITTLEEDWDNAKKRIKKRDAATFHKNKKLVEIEARLLQSYDQCLLLDPVGNVTATDIVKHFKGEKVNSLSFSKVFLEYIKSPDLADSTVSTYDNVIVHWVKYEKHADTVGIYIHLINEDGIRGFERYLRLVGNSIEGTPLKASTRKLYLSKVFRVLSYAKERGYVKDNPSDGLSFPQLDKEILLMNNLHHPVPIEILGKLNERINVNLEPARLLFLWQTWSGMSYVDCTEEKIPMREDQLKIDIQGRKYFEYVRQKTGEKAIIPVFPETKELLNRLKFINIESYSAYLSKLKRIGETIGGIALTSHDGRYTFGLRMLRKGFTMESVSKMLGHAGIDETQKTYVKVDIDKMYSDVERRNKTA